MKTIIAGTRSVTSTALIMEAVRESGFQITEIVSGGCRGPDTIGEAFALHSGVPITKMAADWNKFGRSAGPRRNFEMALYADALILVWDGKSRGSADMLRKAEQQNLKIHQTVVWKKNG